MGKLNEWLQAHASGTLSADLLVAAVREFKLKKTAGWDAMRNLSSGDLIEWVDEQPYPQEDTFQEIRSAHMQGRISKEVYQRLREVAHG